MALRQRQHYNDEDENDDDQNEESERYYVKHEESVSKVTTTRILHYLLRLFAILFVVAVSFVIIASYYNGIINTESLAKYNSFDEHNNDNNNNNVNNVNNAIDDIMIKNNNVKIIQRLLSPGEAQLLLVLKQTNDDKKDIALGLHGIKISIMNKTSCPNPYFVIQLSGDALIYIHLQEEVDNNTAWLGSFQFPLAGSYIMTIKWYGCSSYQQVHGETTVRWDTAATTTTMIPIQVNSMIDYSDNDHLSSNDNDSSIFTSDAAWISTKRLISNNIPSNKLLSMQEYIWTDPNRLNTLQPFIEINHKNNNNNNNNAATVLVSKEGTARSKEEFYKFTNLGNYELLCFIGGNNNTMAKIHTHFLQLRPYIAASQRPFKFHFYEMTSFIHPDQHWTDENKKRWRKCKHLIVSLQDFQSETSVSQKQYQEQVTIFVGHLLRVIPDDTFPIHLLTWTIPTMSSSYSAAHSNDNNNQKRYYCYEDRYLPRTTDHPCNDVIKHLFGKQPGMDGSRKTFFPQRVKILDNSDLVLPWTMALSSLQDDDQKNNHKDVVEALILANIALRIFVVAGKQVTDWRAVGQHGKIDGLHRNGIIEPNFELIPYTGW